MFNATVYGLKFRVEIENRVDNNSMMKRIKRYVTLFKTIDNEEHNMGKFYVGILLRDNTLNITLNATVFSESSSHNVSKGLCDTFHAVAEETLHFEFGDKNLMSAEPDSNSMNLYEKIKYDDEEYNETYNFEFESKNKNEFSIHAQKHSTK